MSAEVKAKLLLSLEKARQVKDVKIKERKANPEKAKAEKEAKMK